jgi:hypothetical protein
MKEHPEISKTFKIAAILLACIGVAAFFVGLGSTPDATWGAYLIAAYYFLSLAIGAAFFLAIQSISQSGWSSAFRRVPEAMMAWIPWAGIAFLLLFFGMKNLYQWAQPEAVDSDALLQHKSAFLNIPFFFIRLILFFVLWSLFAYLIRRASVQEDSFNSTDESGIMRLFHKSELYSKIFIFILALTFTFAAVDWIMSVETHWYSTIFAMKNFIAAFLHGVSIITLIVFILHRRGYYPFLNKYHLHDFARYIFMLSIVWGYMWFAQFMIIWYGNIPEETAYYYFRWQSGWKVMFWLQIILNWTIPFMVLLPVKASRNINIITAVIIVLIIGQYLDLYVEVMPVLTGKLRFGLVEGGIFLGFAGLFALVTGIALTKARLIPHNHPYIEESLNHKFE